MKEPRFTELFASSENSNLRYFAQEQRQTHNKHDKGDAGVEGNAGRDEEIPR